MANKIAKTALVSPKAELDDVEVGDFATIDEGVLIASGSRVEPYAQIGKGVKIGKNVRISQNTVVGGRTFYVDEYGEKKEAGQGVVIGDGVELFEFVFIGRGLTKDNVIEGGVMIHGGSYVGYDVRLHENVNLLPHTTLMGENTVYKGAMLSAKIYVERGCHVGSLTLVSANSHVKTHIPPFLIVSKDHDVSPLNLVGLRRNGYSQEEITALKALYKDILANGKKLDLDRDFATRAEKEVHAFFSKYQSTKEGISF